MWVVRRQHTRLSHCNIDAHLDVQVGTKGKRLVLGEAHPGPATYLRVQVEVVAATAERADKRRQISGVALEHGIKVNDLEVQARDVAVRLCGRSSVHGPKGLGTGSVRGVADTEVVAHAIVAACAVRVYSYPVDFRAQSCRGVFQVHEVNRFHVSRVERACEEELPAA